MSVNAKQLAKITELIDHGALRTVVDSVFPFARAREAFEKGATGHTNGKIVLKVVE